MVPWWHFLLIIAFGVLAVVFIIGGGLVMSTICSIRGSISKGYQVAAISFVLGMANAGIAMALALQEGWAFLFFVAAGLFMGGVCWLMSRFTR